ncbi:MAG: family 1 glycosylhydrolase [Anaerolineae bacterium]|nr:family 1 glycosylhydrolase [Anaerolineae bacterium]
MARATMYFPDDFTWGTATAAYQVEGESAANDWQRWEQEPGRILNGDTAGKASGWWTDAEQDLDAAAAMGMTAHRMGLAWDRLEPEPGAFDEAAFGRYRQILTYMHTRGIEPMVTLHHFVNPLWLVAMGDFNNEAVVEQFRQFTAKVVAELGDLIPKWITINEPLVYITLRYLDGVFPAPQKSGFSAGMEALRNLLRCHAAAYHEIKQHYPDAQVGVAKQYRPMRPNNRIPGAKWWSKRLSWLFNDAWMDAMTDGQLRWPVGSGVIDGLAGSYDFVGINYYTYSLVHFPPWPGRLVNDNYPDNGLIGDGNYGELYPAGLFEAIKWALRYEKPIYITENGVPDDDDDIRPILILTHLREIWRAVSFNFPIMGYYHWSLVDNFEWERGWTQRFGLIALDPETQKRAMRTSAALYAEVCKTNSISSDMARKYAPSLLATMFPG